MNEFDNYDYEAVGRHMVGLLKELGLVPEVREVSVGVDWGNNMKNWIKRYGDIVTASIPKQRGYATSEGASPVECYTCGGEPDPGEQCCVCGKWGLEVNPFPEKPIFETSNPTPGQQPLLNIVHTSEAPKPEPLPISRHLGNLPLRRRMKEIPVHTYSDGSVGRPYGTRAWAIAALDLQKRGEPLFKEVRVEFDPRTTTTWLTKEQLEVVRYYCATVQKMKGLLNE